MAEHASTDCQYGCPVLKGSAYDVCSFEGEPGAVRLVDRLDNVSSVALADLGAANGHYLQAIRACTGPGKGKYFGFGKAPCGAKIGDNMLSEYVIGS